MDAQHGDAGSPAAGPSPDGGAAVPPGSLVDGAPVLRRFSPNGWPIVVGRATVPSAEDLLLELELPVIEPAGTGASTVDNSTRTPMPAALVVLSCLILVGICAFALLMPGGSAVPSGGGVFPNSQPMGLLPAPAPAPARSPEVPASPTAPAVGPDASPVAQRHSDPGNGDGGWDGDGSGGDRGADRAGGYAPSGHPGAGAPVKPAAVAGGGTAPKSPSPSPAPAPAPTTSQPPPAPPDPEPPSPEPPSPEPPATEPASPAAPDEPSNPPAVAPAAPDSPAAAPAAPALADDPAAPATAASAS